MSKIKAILSGVYIGLIITFASLAVGYFMNERILVGVIESLCALIEVFCLYILNRRPKPKVKVIELSEEELKEFIKKLLEELEKDQEEKEE